MPSPDTFDVPAEIVRRAPFGHNPDVGVRGQRTRRRILDAAVDVLGEQGYHGAGIGLITRRAGCSRASFYQYFASKEEVFRHLAGLVAREITASIEALGTVTPDRAGRDALRDWIATQAEIQARFAPVFSAFDAAARVDEEVATGSARWERGAGVRFRARLAVTGLPDDEVGPVIALLRESVSRTLEMTSILHVARPADHDAERIADALADLVHRALFGAVDGVNLGSPGRRPPPVRFDHETIVRLRDERCEDLTENGRHTRDALLRAGTEVMVARGYHLMRVDDVVERAGVSHGAFYRYFDSKDDLARVLSLDAATKLNRVLQDFPGVDAADAVTVRAWVERYARTQADEVAVLRAWLDAAIQDAALRLDIAPAVDWGRRFLSAQLAPRGFGDIDADALYLLGLLNTLGSVSQSSIELDAATTIVRRALYGLPA